jgi:hypothetical protein
MVEGTWGLPEVTDPTREGPTLVTSTKPNHLPELPPPKTVTLGLGISPQGHTLRLQQLYHLPLPGLMDATLAPCSFPSWHTSCPIPLFLHLSSDPK